MSVVEKVRAAGNADGVSRFRGKGELPLPPGRHFAILTCMDTRLDPAQYAGLAEGDALVVRNVGGRATDDAIRSLVGSHRLFGANEWFVIHHTGAATEDLLETSVREDVARLRSHPLVPASVAIHGYVYDPRSGYLFEVLHTGADAQISG